MDHLKIRNEAKDHEMRRIDGYTSPSVFSQRSGGSSFRDLYVGRRISEENSGFIRREAPF